MDQKVLEIILYMDYKRDEKIKTQFLPFAMQGTASEVTILLKNMFLNKETYDKKILVCNFVHVPSYGGIFVIFTLQRLRMKVD